MQQKEIGMQISAARKKLKYTQRELAEKLGVSDKTISKWERGAGYPDISLLLPLCRELGIEVSQLLGDEETDTQKQGNEKNLKNLADYAVLKVKENRERIQRWIWIMLSAFAVLSIGICLLCNYVLEGAISWAWIAVVSVIYGWMILTALLMSHRYLIEKTMLVGMVMLFPYLYCLSLQLPISNFLPLTWTIAAAADVFAVLIYLVLLHSRISLWFKLAIIVILSGIFNYFVQWLTEGGLSQMLLQLFGNLIAAVILAIVGIYASRHAK